MVRCIIWCAVSSRAQTEPDKISLPHQESDSRALAEKNGWEIIDVLRVPGHSRRYVDFHRLEAEASEQGVDAFQRLRRHWEDQDFDVMIVRDGDRFARTQALHAYVVERTINIKARIYSLQDGWIDETNYRMWIAMGGYKAAGDIDRLVKSRDRAMTARAQRGLPITSRIPLSHKVVRDPNTGKAVELVVNEDRRRLWNDLAELILEGISWYHIESELYERYGHVNDKGKKFYSGFMYRLIMKPIFWGHMARHHNSKKSKNGYKTGYWVYDETEEIPEGAIIYRNTHDPVYKGELADRVKIELRRRSEVVRGRAKSDRTHPFSGLGVCANCGSFWATRVVGNYRGLHCPAVHSNRDITPDCDNRRTLNQKRLIERVNDLLKQMLEHKSTDVFNERDSVIEEAEVRLEQLVQEIAQLELEARNLIRQQVKAGDQLQPFYQDELDQINTRLANMRRTRKDLEKRETETHQTTRLQEVALEELADMSLEAFWKQETRYINQVLHRLMGKKRFLLLDGDIIGVAEVNRPQRRHG